jgi:hypothetical protein
MSKHGTWTVVFPDQLVIKRTGEFGMDTALGYNCGGTDFWLQSKFSNLHAIQFTDDNTDNDQVEYKDSRPNSGYDTSLFGDFRQFIDLWDSKHLSVLQEAWDNNLVVTGVNELGENIYETTEVKIARLGERPINYTS